MLTILVFFKIHYELLYYHAAVYNRCFCFPYSGEPIPTVEYTPAEIDTW